MSQRKLIVVLGLVALVALSAGVSQASLSRVEGMNLTVPTLSQFTDDYANIYYYPTSVVRQNNLVLAEVGNNPDGDVNRVAFFNQSFTVVRNFPRFGAIAFQMKGSALNNPEASGSLNHEQLDAIWGRAFTKIDVAVRLDITNSKSEISSSTAGVTTGFKNLGDSYDFSNPFPFGFVGPDEILGEGVELNTWGITPSIAIHMQGDDRVECAVTIRKYTLDRTQQDTAPGSVLESWQDAGNTSYAVLARAVLNQGDKHVWYPAGWYVNDDLGWSVSNAGNNAGVNRSADETYKFYGVGISDNMKVNENNLLLWGVQVSQFKHEYTRGDDNTGAGPTGNPKTLTEKTTEFPLVFAAIETDATKCLKIRMGASRALMTTNDEETTFGATPTTTTIKTRGSDFRFGLGTGIRWNNLDIDMTLNQEFPLSGGYILSGNQATPFTRVSATYHF